MTSNGQGRLRSGAIERSSISGQWPLKRSGVIRWRWESDELPPLKRARALGERERLCREHRDPGVLVRLGRLWLVGHRAAALGLKRDVTEPRDRWLKHRVPPEQEAEPDDLRR